MDNLTDDGWKLICPPKNWQKPVTINEDDLELIELLSDRLKLVMTRDDKRKKIYLGTAVTSDASTANGVKYPSGWSAEVVSDSKAGAQYKAVDPAAAAPLIKAFPDAQISKNFRLSEFRPGGYPHSGSKTTYEYIRISPALVRALEDIRTRAGMPITVTSGYRPPDYNREIGGVSNSTHIDGLAADIYCDGLSTAQLYDICEQVIGKRGGVGYYPKSGFVHVDLRGYEARWSGT